MKKNILGLIILSMFISLVFADGRFAIRAGEIRPDNDPAVKTYLNKGLTFDLNFGEILTSNIEPRLDMGMGFIGPVQDSGFNLYMSTFKARGAALYHFNKRGVFDPYLGVGLGAYSYTIRESTMHIQKQGTLLGLSGTVGFDYKIGDINYFNVEYTRINLPSVFFTEGRNTDLSMITFGLALHFQGGTSKTSTHFHSGPVTAEDLKKLPPIALPPVHIQIGKPTTTAEEKPTVWTPGNLEDIENEKTEQENAEKEKENNKYKEKHPDQVPPGWDEEKHGETETVLPPKKPDGNDNKERGTSGTASANIN